MTKKKSNGSIVIDSQRCKGCGLCIWVCPTNHIRLNDQVDQRGIHVACFEDNHGCTGCSFCAIVCPDVAISVYKMASSKGK